MQLAFAKQLTLKSITNLIVNAFLSKLFVKNCKTNLQFFPISRKKCTMYVAIVLLLTFYLKSLSGLING